MSTAAERHLATVVPGILAEASAIALEHFRTDAAGLDGAGTENKNAGTGLGYDPVTVADRGIEDLIRDRLTAAFPEHQVTGEERGTTGPAGRFRWLIDPIDGTKAFVTGSPMWGILLGLLDEGRPVAGWMHQPYTGETFSGIDGVSEFRRGDERHPMRTRATRSLAEAVVYTTSPHFFSPGRQSDGFAAISDAAKLVRYGGDCYAYCLVALGCADIVIEGNLQPYDIVPIIPIIEAAGGVVSGVDGQPAAEGGYVLAASTRQVHDEALALISPLDTRGRCG